MGKITDRTVGPGPAAAGWVAALAALLVACGATTTFDAAVTLDRAAYAPGDTAIVRLVNDGSTDLYYNLCPRRLERRGSDQSWTEAPEFPSDQACPASLERLPPGRSTTDSIAFPDPLADGTYRWIFTGLSRDEIAGGAFSLATGAVTITQ